MNASYQHEAHVEVPARKIAGCQFVQLQSRESRLEARPHDHFFGPFHEVAERKGVRLVTRARHRCPRGRRGRSFKTRPHLAPVGADAVDDCPGFDGAVEHAEHRLGKIVKGEHDGHGVAPRRHFTAHAVRRGVVVLVVIFEFREVCQRERRVVAFVRLCVSKARFRERAGAPVDARVLRHGRWQLSEVSAAAAREVQQPTRRVLRVEVSLPGIAAAAVVSAHVPLRVVCGRSRCAVRFRRQCCFWRCFPPRRFFSSRPEHRVVGSRVVCRPHLLWFIFSFFQFI